MFNNTIDSKYTYTNNDNVEMLDLTDTIFKSSVNSNTVFSYYRVRKDMEMRPDKISFSAYGSDMYTEMVMKYSFIDNPFAIQYKDIIAVPILSMIYTDVKDLYIQRGNPESDDYAFVKNYHKYIDKSKIPTSNASSGAGNIYSTSSNSGTNLLGSTSGTNLYVNTGIGDSYYNDLDNRESYGNVMGYGSDYNQTDGNDNFYSGGYSDYYGRNTLDSNGYPVRENYDTSTSGGTGPTGNSLTNGFSGGSASGKSATALNNDIYGSRGYGQGGGTYGDGSYSYNKGLLTNGVSYDDNDDIITETLYDENGNEVQTKRTMPTDTEVFNPNEYGPVEPNMANNNTSGVTITNGRIYFGDSNVSTNPNDISDVDGTNKVDNPLVDCARTGISLGQFLNATTKNNLKNSK